MLITADTRTSLASAVRRRLLARLRVGALADGELALALEELRAMGGTRPGAGGVDKNGWELGIAPSARARGRWSMDRWTDGPVDRWEICPRL